MKELKFGDKIKIGDKLKVGSKIIPITIIKDGKCFVYINRITLIELPVVYSESFKLIDEIDPTIYEVYRE